MRKEISKRWKLDVRHIVEENDMSGVLVFDSQFKDSVVEANGKITERKGDNDLDLTPVCDFCGSHLRYVSVIEASNMNGITNYKVGIDCLALILGQNDPLVKNISKNVRELAKAAKARKTREKNLADFAEELQIIKEIVEAGYSGGVISSGYDYIMNGKVISDNFASYLRSSIDKVKYNFVTYRDQISVLKSMVDEKEAGNFERDMFYALIRGRNISPRMEEVINNIVKRNSPEARLAKRKALASMNTKIDKLISMIEYVDVNLIGRPIAGQYTSYDTICSIKYQLNNRGFITPKQVNKVNNVYNRIEKGYEKKKLKDSK